MSLAAHPLPTADARLTPADCSVVICAHTMRRWRRLRAAVESAVAQGAGQVIVVVDHNDELRALSARELTAATTIANPNAQGISGARNAGVRSAERPIVVFLDDDAVALPGWLDALTGAYDDPAVVGVGGRIVGSWETSRPRWFPAEFDWVVGCTYKGMPTEREDVRNAIGANMSFRRAVFERIGEFDERFGRVGHGPAGCDETEFSLRVRRLIPGARIVYEPRAAVEHFVPAERATWSYFRRRCWGEGRSKSMVVEAAGAADGTASERRYALRTLPAGALAGLCQFATLRDRFGAARAAAITIGLTTTGAAYAGGRITRRLRI